MSPRIVHPIRVIFGDTDAMGVVYYANYLRYFEAARGALLRSLGRSYGEIERDGLSLPVVEARCRYRAPARYDEDLAVEAEIVEVGRASFRFRYAVRRGDTLIAEGETAHACTDRNGRPCRLPEELRGLLAPA